MFSQFFSRANFPASNCAAQIFTYVPMTLFLSLNYLTANAFRDASLGSCEGKIPAYVTFVCFIASLSMHLNSNYQNHPDFIDVEKKKLELKEAALTIVSRMRFDKESTRLFLETQTELDAETISELLDEDINTMSTQKILCLFPVFEEIYRFKHPQNMSKSQKAQKLLSSAFSGLLHGLAHLNIPILLNVFANKHVIRDHEFSPEEIIGRMLIVLGVYSIIQSTLYNLKPKIPTTNDLLTCLKGSFFQQPPKRALPSMKNESTPLLQVITVRGEKQEDNFKKTEEIIVRRRAGADTNMPCCMAGHGI